MTQPTRLLRMGFVAALALAVGWGVTRLWLPGTADNRAAQGALGGEQQAGAFGATVVTDTASLPGSLVFVEERGQPNYRIIELDFASQRQRPVLAIAEDAFVYQLAPDAERGSVLLTYSAPPSTSGFAAGEQAYDRNGIYALNLADGRLSRLLGGDRAGVYYANPRRSGAALFYEIYQQSDPAGRIERYDLAAGRATVIAEGATMPAVSPAGDLVAFFRVNSQTQARSLWLADALGDAQPREIVAESAFPDLNLLLFAPDGRALYFAAAEAPAAPEQQSLLEQVFGAGTASAHGNHDRPARWYRVAIGGANSAPEPLTDIQRVPAATALHAAILGNAGADRLGFVGQDGLYLIDNGGNAQIIRSRTMRSIAWLP